MTKSNVIIGIKVSPDFEDSYLVQLATCVSKYDRMFINCGNTSLKNLPVYGLKSTALSRGKGGVSGPFLFRRTCHIVSLLVPIGVPIMATGGICTFDDVLVLKRKFLKAKSAPTRPASIICNSTETPPGSR